MKLKIFFLALISEVCFLFPGQGMAQDKLQLNLDTNPTVIGDLVAENLAGRRFGWRYQKVCSYYGALIFADQTGNTEITDKIEEGFKPFLNGKKKARSGHVDFNVFGIWPFELYQQSGNNTYLEMGKELADDEFKNPGPDGLTELTRFWVDDMYMVGSLQVQAYKATGNQLYLDRAARHLVSYIDSLQRPNGLFYHRPDAPHYWGRGNGWGAAALGEILSVMPEDHEQYEVLVTAYRKMMKGILQFQGDDGMWHQILNDHESFRESSCTGMFLYALITGLDKGILAGKEYIVAVEKAWNALTTNFVNEKGEVLNVSMWTNAKKRVSYYHHRPRIPGDYHGQAAVLWASTAMLRYLDSNDKP